MVASLRLSYNVQQQIYSLWIEMTVGVNKLSTVTKLLIFVHLVLIALRIL